MELPGEAWRGLERELALGLTEWPRAVLTSLIMPMDPYGSVPCIRGWFLLGRGGACLQVLTWVGRSLATGPYLGIGEPLAVLAALFTTTDTDGSVSGGCG